MLICQTQVLIGKFLLHNLWFREVTERGNQGSWLRIETKPLISGCAACSVLNVFGFFFKSWLEEFEDSVCEQSEQRNLLLKSGFG